MVITAYNSEDKYYKSVKGGLKAGESVRFRIIVPRSFGANSARLSLKEDSQGEYLSKGMYWAGMYGDEHEVWDIETQIPDSGLYWYHFDISSPWGETRLCKTADFTGAFSPFGAEITDWQITVCTSDFTTPDWLKGGVIYQIFPDRFYNSGEKKENVPSDRVLRTDTENQPYWRPDEEGKVLNNDYFGGDLRGIEKKLPYLSELGVTCIYLNPIFEAHSNHRYNTADYTRIDPLLGTEADFVSLCKSAHKRGIKIILDGVFSHTGDDSVYFNRYRRYGDGGAYNSKESPYFKWYKFQHYPDEYTSWWGFDTLPEVTEECEDYLEFITGENGVVVKWLKLGADGWRLDVADELPDVFIDAVRRAVKRTDPNALLLGEVWEDATNKFSYGQRRKFLLGEQFDSVMNYPFANAVLDFARYGVAEDFMKSVMSIVGNYPKQALDVMMNHIGTHDTERAITRIVGESCEYRDRQWQSEHYLSPEQKEKGICLMKLAATLQFMLPGVPSVYYGDEIAMQGYKDPFNRAYFEWADTQCGLREYYVALGKLRRDNECLKDGELESVSAALGCVAFSRCGKKESLLVIANRNENGITYKLPRNWYDAENALNGEKYGESVFVDGMSAVVLKKRTELS